MYFQKNLEALKKNNPQLAEKLVEYGTGEGTAEAFESQIAGAVTGRAKKPMKDYKILLHSMVDPYSEAVEQVNEITGLERKYLVIIFGFGFGYHVRELLRRKLKRGLVVVVEPRLDIFKLALKTMDLTDILSEKSLYIIDAEDSLNENLYEIFRRNSAYMKSIDIFQLPAYEYLVDGGLKDLRKMVNDMIIYNLTNMGDDPGDTLIGIANAFNNMEYLVESFDISALKSKYKNVPAVIVAAGPSLDKNFHLLKEIEGKAVIFCPDVLIQRFVASGIKPDIICALERTCVYENYIKDKEMPEKAVFLGQSVIESEIFPSIRNKKAACLKEKTVFEKLLSDMLNGLNTFDSGQSVSTMCFSIARLIGCDPIILIGQNLSYSLSGKTHASGTIYENMDVDKDKKNDGLKDTDVFRVKGNYEEFVLTKPIWYQFLNWYNIEIPKTDATVINATEGGAYINGTKLMSFREAIDQYCTGTNRVNIYEDVEKPPIEKIQFRLAGLAEGLKNELGRLASVKSEFLKIQSFCNEVLQGKINPNLVVERIKAIIEIRMNIQDTSKLFSFIVQAPRMHNFMQDTEFVSLNSMQEILAWTEIQHRFSKDMLNICEKVIQLFRYGCMKAEKLRESKETSRIELAKILSETGE